MKNGFTLAEVLVTLGIIGVVSAMTIPTLIKNHQRNVYVSQLQKVYAELSQAFDKVLTDSNAISLRESKMFPDGAAANFFNRYFKVIQTCTGTDLDGCFVEHYENLAGETIRARDLINSSMDCATIASGASICTGVVCLDDEWWCNYIFVDVNGKQGPNIVGRDFFHFFVDSTGQIIGTDEFTDEHFEETKSDWDDYGIFLQKILNDGWKMEY